MASRIELTFAQRAEKHPNALTRQLFAIAERKQTNIVLSADLTSTDDLLKIADGACHPRTQGVASAGVLG